MATDEFPLNKGSTLKFTFNWPDGQGGNADLTGYTVGIYDPHPSIDGRISVEFSDEAVGEISGVLIWHEGIPFGRIASFRIIIIAPNGETATTNALWINVE